MREGLKFGVEAPRGGTVELIHSKTGKETLAAAMGLQRSSALAITLALAVVLYFAAPASSQPGYLNIDCGAPKNYSDYYYNWVTDTGYIETGYNSGPVYAKGDELDLRFFNDSRQKHCYTLPTEPDTTYLVRASFLYGNFTELYGNITFDLTIDSTYWTTIVIQPVVNWYDDDNYGVWTILRREAIVRSTGTRLYMCLLRKFGLPFITSLQLRKFADNMYEEVKNNQILVTNSRWTASIWGQVRYPDDPYDRVWTTYSSSYGAEMYAADEQSLQFENTTVIPTSTDINLPPVYCLENAYIWNETTDVGWFYLTNLTQTSGRFYVAVYFQEIDDLVKATEKKGKRNVAFGLNGVPEVNGQIEVTLDVSTISTVFESTDTSFNFTFSRADHGSKLGPMFNALELYSVYPVDPSYTAPEDVTALQFLLSSLHGIGIWNGDPCYPVPWEWITCNNALPSKVTQLKLSGKLLNGTIPPDINGLTELTDLWLDNNKIQGDIPDLGKLIKLVTLHLQNNSLEGPIPASLGALPALEELFLQNNNLSGPIPPSLLAPRNGVKFSFVYDGNQDLQTCLPENGPCLPTNQNTNSSGPGSGTNAPGAAPATQGGGVNPALIAGVAVGGACVVLAFVFLYCCFLKRSPISDAGGYKKGPGGLLSDDASQKLQARVFSMEDIATMTSNFAKKLGQGSFGPVYYGTTIDGQEVAVKVNAADSSQGTEEFINEVVLLSRVHHKYLVSLVGYCQAPQQHILVYAFMPNGTLTEHLHGDRAQTNPLTWIQRLEIALNAAQGLEYLHTFCNPPIIHRDIKPSNILLDNNLMAKVADFGMSKSAPEESKTGFSTAVKGTFGYLDPEYLSGWRLTTKSDVYSFGVILLELITGRKPTSLIHFADGTQGNFMGWARSAQKNGDVMSIVDPDLDGNFNQEVMLKVADLALASVATEGVNRPDMGEIVRWVMEAIKMENADGKNNNGQGNNTGFNYASPRNSNSQPSYNSVGSYAEEMTHTYNQPR
ncbi:hypothetical protein R1sor_025167 [Riccia sorocarpa]|uniref:non-specific serine/threonine protein kinase n=1 Tax=Riccia sorocarpa TaxID=122646 RepID=A0ABD3GBQ3_9MARC